MLIIGAAPAHAQGSITLPAEVAEYTPFEVVVRTSKSYCHDSRFPLLGEVQYNAGALSAVLTHIRSPLGTDSIGNACGQARRFVLPGLPRGRQTLKIDVTDSSDFSPTGRGGANVSETIVAILEITAVSPGDLAYFWSGFFTPGLGGAVGFLLTPTDRASGTTNGIGSRSASLTSATSSALFLCNLPVAYPLIYFACIPSNTRCRMAVCFGRRIDQWPNGWQANGRILWSKAGLQWGV